ncbi:hypothetical protein, partial [Bacteroides gallinaceum]|uniref:hypothetical protein n=1 Tax=Bacteroides gallinaceum TaxID=1462571 RepID=UPI00195D4D29
TCPQTGLQYAPNSSKMWAKLGTLNWTPYKITHRNRYKQLFFAKCKSRFYQMQKTVRNYLLTFAPEFNKS